jgi:hypothetical protein
MSCIAGSFLAKASWAGPSSKRGTSVDVRANARFRAPFQRDAEARFGRAPVGLLFGEWNFGGEVVRAIAAGQGAT